MAKQSELEQGKQIALEIRRTTAAELKLELTDLAWQTEPEHRDDFSVPLAFRTMDGSRHILRLFIGQLEDAPADPVARAAIARTVHDRLKKLGPTRRRIGF